MKANELANLLKENKIEVIDEKIIEDLSQKINDNFNGVILKKEKEYITQLETLKQNQKTMDEVLQEKDLVAKQLEETSKLIFEKDLNVSNLNKRIQIIKKTKNDISDEELEDLTILAEKRVSETKTFDEASNEVVEKWFTNKKLPNHNSPNPTTQAPKIASTPQETADLIFGKK